MEYFVFPVFYSVKGGQYLNGRNLYWRIRHGMVIKMYFRQSEHNPPHIHVIYGECVGVIDIRTGEMLEGDLSKRALKMVQEWVKQHENDLIKI